MSSQHNVCAQQFDESNHSPTRVLRGDGRLIALAKVLYAMCDDDRFGAEQIGIFVALARHTDTANKCFPSQTLLGKHLGKSRSWVSAQISSLVEIGLIKKTRRWQKGGGEQSCLYELVLSPEIITSRTADISEIIASSNTFPVDVPKRQPADTSSSIANNAQDSDTVCLGANTPCHRADTNLSKHYPVKHEEKGDTRLSSYPASEGACLPLSDNKELTGEVHSLDLASISRTVQKASSKPWRLVNATSAVQAAVERSGLEAVRRVSVEITGSGLSPWEITARLDSLPPLAHERQALSGQPCSSVTSPAKKPAAAGTLPKGCPDGTMDRLLARRVEREHIRHWISAISEVIVEKYQATIIVSSSFLRSKIEGCFEADLRAALQVDRLDFVVVKNA